jgi:MFS transporter, SP family, general alpha glucoside:H+ symporter
MVAMMIHTNQIEMDIEAGTSYWHCFKGTNYRRTEIACMVFAGQVLSGSEFAYSGTFFFEQAGLNSETTYNLNLGGTAIAFVGTIISWFLMKAVRRRTLYLTGLGALSTCLLLIGTLHYAYNQPAVYAQSAFCIIWLFCFSLTVGPGGWYVTNE